MWKASFAAPIAFRVSISSAMVTLPITLLSAGFTRSTTWVPWGVTNWPLIYARSKALTGVVVSCVVINPLFEVRSSGRAFPVAHEVENTRDQRTSREQKLDQQVRPEGMDQVERASLLHPMSPCVETNFGCTLLWQQ